VEKYKYHKDGTQPQDGEVFVFGSNLAGIHGAGAAREAHRSYGAIMNRGMGLMGQSYAIPTKNERIQTIPLKDIAVYVKLFIAATEQHYNRQFFITRIGCGLAGYTDADIAPMFKNSLTNCNFPEEWREFLE
jgi:hypothetical protein